MSVSVNHLVIEKIGFEKIFDFLPYPFLIAELAEPSYEVIYVNQKFLAEVGYVCEEIKTMDNWFTRAYPDSHYRNEVRSSWGQQFEAAKREGRDFVQMKVLIHTKSNGYKWYEVKSSIAGSLQLVAFVNIHDVISKEEELRKLNEHKNNVLSILAHDLRSPIISLHSLTELALHKIMSQEEFFEVIRRLNEKSRKTLDMLDTTLLWAKSNFDTLQVSKKEVDVFQIVNSILAVYESSSKDKHLDIKVEMCGNTVLTDPDIFTILVRNLLSNAIKYTPNGGVITISSRKTGDSFSLAIKDTGIGLSLEQLTKIRLLRVSSSVGTNSEKGFGIGLRLCMHLAQKINGEITLESLLGEGTCASVLVRE